MEEFYARRIWCVFLIMLYCMALFQPVISYAFEDQLKGKRGFPGADVRGSALVALKRISGLDEKRDFPGADVRGSGFVETVALLNDDAYAKRAFEEVGDENMDKIRSGPNINGFVTDTKQPVLRWPVGIELSNQQKTAALNRYFDIQQGMMSLKRSDYQFNRDYLAEKRKKLFDTQRGELSWKRKRLNGVLLDNRQFVLDDDPRL